MRILTNENKSFSMSSVPEQVDDLMYGVLDYNNVNDVDYHFVPLFWLESFTYTVADIKIGNYSLQMPMDWHVLIVAGDELEVVKIEHLLDKDFKAFCFNPISGYMPQFLTVDIKDMYSEIKWFFPKLKYGHLLVVPLTDGPTPLCAYFVKDAHKLPEVLDLSKLL